MSSDFAPVIKYVRGRNQKVVGERKVKVREIRVRKRNDLILKKVEQGDFSGAPYHVVAILEIDGSPGMWPMMADGSPGMWFPNEEEWEKDEDRFRELLAQEVEELRWVTEEVER